MSGRATIVRGSHAFSLPSASILLARTVLTPCTDIPPASELTTPVTLRLSLKNPSNGGLSSQLLEPLLQQQITKLVTDNIASVLQSPELSQPNQLTQTKKRAYPVQVAISLDSVPIYDAQPDRRCAAVNSGNVHLTVGGPIGINRAFGRKLRHLKGYQQAHEAVVDMARTLEPRTYYIKKFATGPVAECIYRPLFKGVHYVRGGVFIDRIRQGFRPMSDKNAVMVYAVPPDSNAGHWDEYTKYVQLMTTNLMKAVKLYNTRHKADPIQEVRLCAYGSIRSRHASATMSDVTDAIMEGVMQGPTLQEGFTLRLIDRGGPLARSCFKVCGAG